MLFAVVYSTFQQCFVFIDFFPHRLWVYVFMHVCMCHNLMLVYLFFLNSQACWGPLQDLVIFINNTTILSLGWPWNVSFSQFYAHTLCLISYALYLMAFHNFLSSSISVVLWYNFWKIPLRHTLCCHLLSWNFSSNMRTQNWQLKVMI